MAKIKPQRKQAPVPALPSNVPAYLRHSEQGTRGMENVGTEDVQIPRLEVVQDQSDVRKDSSARYNEDAEPGHLCNTMTGELYADSRVEIVPVFYQRVYNIWIDRKAGGGFRGSFPDIDAAKEASRQIKEKHEIIPTPQHLVLVVRDHGKAAEEALLPMPKTKEKISRKLNSLVKMSGADRFARSYVLGTTEETNRRSEDYWNFTIAPESFPSEDVFKQAELLYEQVSTGKRKVQTNYGDNEAPDGDDDEPAEPGRKGAGKGRKEY